MAEPVAHLERHRYVERVPDELYGLARDFVASTEAEWGRRLGKAKMKQLRGLLEAL